ncbi:MAG TPA: T9SS type A sorting domain-containing protein, partial [Chitinophagaceae bacterium]|nr:T9SS type A sorting domain-containing protein [Chitinophagaceae bacterium]
RLNGFGAVIFQNNTQYLTGPAGAYQTIVATRAILGYGYQYLFSSPANVDFSVRCWESASAPYSINYTQGPNGEDWDAWKSYPSYNLWLNGAEGTYCASATHILVDEAGSATNATFSISNTFSGRGMYNNDPVYELMAYNGTLNNTQRVLLENYQASEWGLTALLPGSGYTIFTPPGSSSYNRNLVGIGNSGSDNFLADVAGSTDGFGFSSGSTGSDFLGAAGYAMAAHNNQRNIVNYNPSLNNVPANTYVWNRSWYVQLFGGNSAGNITLAFNFNDYNGTSPNPSYSFKLLYNPLDGTFGSGTNTLVPASGNVSGNSVSFAVNAANLPNGYYTIIYAPLTLLPMTLENFSVTKLLPDAALAKWTVGPGFGRGCFTLQHSADGIQFTPIGTVAAADNNSFANNYSYTDNAPFLGINYYRLVMANAAGDILYSPVDMLKFSETARPVTLYPTPAKDILHIGAPGIRGARNVDLVSVTGQVLESYSISKLDGSTLSVGRLPTGSYFVRIRGGGQSFVLPFLKQ